MFEHSSAERRTYLFAVAALVAAVTSFTTAPFGAGLVIGLGAALVPWALVAGGTRVPPVALVVWELACVAVLMLALDAPGASFLLFLTVMWTASVTVARPVVGLAVVGTTGLLIAEAVQHVAQNPDEQFIGDTGVVYFVTGVLLSWFGGHMIRRQTLLAARLGAAQAQLEQAAAAAERRRIAREVHDVVGHSLTVVMLNVSGARRVLTTDPAAADAALACAETVGRESLDNVRQVVGLLRDDDGAATSEAPPPLPSVEDVPALVDRHRRAGMDIELSVEGEVAALDAATGVTLYRVVQESLANAEHHAPQERVRVTVGARPEEAFAVITNEAANDAPSDRASTNGTMHRAPEGGPHRQGLGLVGMRERVAALDGRMEAGPTATGWSVACELPLTRTIVARP